nr:hypothetical protein VIGAN_02031300 [Ipomoea batatas]
MIAVSGVGYSDGSSIVMGGCWCWWWLAVAPEIRLSGEERKEERHHFLGAPRLLRQTGTNEGRRALSLSFGVVGGGAEAEILLLEGGEVMLTLAAFGGGNPRALHVRLALKASALTASSAPHVCAIFLGLVSTVLAVNPAASAAASPAAARPHNSKPGGR